MAIRFYVILFFICKISKKGKIPKTYLLVLSYNEFSNRPPPTSRHEFACLIMHVKFLYDHYEIVSLLG